MDNPGNSIVHIATSSVYWPSWSLFSFSWERPFALCAHRHPSGGARQGPPLECTFRV